MSKNSKKYYAVKKGLVPGIYNTWQECQQNINGFSGAIYKSFNTIEEAELFINEEITEVTRNDIKRIYSEAEAVSYVDGSYNSDTNEYAYGVVIFYDGGEEHFAEKYKDDEMAKMHNVAGEIEGAKRAMRFCIENNIKSVDIFYDYEGIAAWCTGAWQAKQDGTKDYKKYYNSIKDRLTVNFVKVKAHTGDTYNEMADELAKSALGLVQTSSVLTRDNGVVAKGIKQDDLEGIIDLLKEDYADLVLVKNNIPYGTRYELQISNPTKQKLYVNYYTDKNKIWVSGRKEDLFNAFTMYVVELIDTDKIPEFLNTVHNLNIDKDIVETEFYKYLPNASDRLPVVMNNYLHQAIYNLQVDGDVYVANYLVEPAIRPIEGLLKIALQKNGFPIQKEDKDYDTFFIFKEKEYGYVIKEQFLGNPPSREVQRYLCKCYKFYRENRHTLFHWDNPLADEDTTRIINTTTEAHAIIQDALALIDEYYSL
jgi:ribonuclease HI